MKLPSLIFILFLIINSGCNSYPSTSLQEDTITKGVKIDSIVVYKSQRLMIAFSKKEKIKTYNIALGKNPVGRKQFKGDFKTPEGLYIIDAKSTVSKYHKNLNISYPNKKDIIYARSKGKTAGGEIKIHGLPNGFKDKDYVLSDWTWGCIAVTNSEIDELFEFVSMGCKILILP